MEDALQTPADCRPSPMLDGLSKVWESRNGSSDGQAASQLDPLANGGRRQSKLLRDGSFGVFWQIVACFSRGGLGVCSFGWSVLKG